MDETIPQVDGLRLLARCEPDEPVGRGEVWRARSTGGLAGAGGSRLPADLPGVGECLVRLLRLPVDEALRARAQTLAQDLTALDDPGLMPIRSVRKAYDGVALVYGHAPAAATGLHLIVRRRWLAAGEVVTLGVALSWALAHAHAAGVVHGRLCDADVLIGGDGRPVLTGVGVLGVLGAGGEPGGDVRALERLLASVLDRESPGAARVVQALAEGCASAAELAAALAGAAPAVPIAVGELAPGPRDGHPPPAARPGSSGRLRRPAWARPRILVAATGAVLLGAAAGWVSVPGAHPRSPGAPAPASGLVPAGAAAWAQVLTRLDEARSAAFAQPGASDFAVVDVPSGPAYRYDTAAAAALRARGVHAAGLRMVLLQVAVESAATGRVVLRVTDQRPSYELRDAGGRVVSTVAERGSVTHRIELEGPGKWRMLSVSAAAPAVSS